MGRRPPALETALTAHLRARTSFVHQVVLHSSGSERDVDDGRVG